LLIKHKICAFHTHSLARRASTVQRARLFDRVIFEMMEAALEPYFICCSLDGGTIPFSRM
jgi:hypothetical protein